MVNEDGGNWVPSLEGEWFTRMVVQVEVEALLHGELCQPLAGVADLLRFQLIGQAVKFEPRILA